MLDIKLTEAKKIQEHAKLVMTWRNNPETLKMFYNQEPKVWSSFWPEYCTDYFGSTSLNPCFAEFNGEKIAFLRSNQYELSAEFERCFDIDINIAPKMRGKGLGSKILNSFSMKIFESGANYIIAEVKKINIASEKAFLKAGFEFHDSIIRNLNSGSCEVNRFIKRKQL